MKKHIFFLDIDGTLIQPNQKPNTDQLPAVINKVSEKGLLFGLNSNRSLEDVIPIYNMFGLNGPVVLENGVYFQRSINTEKIFLIDSPKLIKDISVKAIKNFISQNNLDCDFQYGDTVKIIESEDLLVKIPLGIYLNGFRLYTGSVHIFRYGARDFDLAIKLRDYMRNHFAEHGLDYSVESPKAFGNVVFWPSQASKGIALHKMKKDCYSDYEFMMIGDDLADIETRQEVSLFFAVGNSQPEVKQAADYVAKEEYTKGVVEIIEKYLISTL